MKKYKIIKKLSFIIINLVLIIAIYILNKDIIKARTLYNIGKINLDFIIIGFIVIAFGLLIEYDRLLRAFKIGFKINIYKFILAIIMAVISISPYGYLMVINLKLGILLNYQLIRFLLSIWSGILIARSLIIKKIPEFDEVKSS